MTIVKASQRITRQQKAPQKGPGSLLVPAAAAHGERPGNQETAARPACIVGVPYKGRLTADHRLRYLDALKAHRVDAAHQLPPIVYTLPAFAGRAFREAAAEFQQIPELLAVKAAGPAPPVHILAPVQIQYIQQQSRTALINANTAFRQFRQRRLHVRRRPAHTVPHQLLRTHQRPEPEGICNLIELPVHLHRFKHPLHQVLTADVRVLVNPWPQVLQQPGGPPLFYRHIFSGQNIRRLSRADLRSQTHDGILPAGVGAVVCVVFYHNLIIRVGAVERQDRRPLNIILNAQGSVGQRLAVGLFCGREKKQLLLAVHTGQIHPDPQSPSTAGLHPPRQKCSHAWH